MGARPRLFSLPARKGGVRTRSWLETGKILLALNDLPFSEGDTTKIQEVLDDDIDEGLKIMEKWR